MKCSLIAIVGKPNSGKSTLLNQIMGQKISIVTPKVQTTRVNVRGVYNENDCQLIFTDTPGLFNPRDGHKLEEFIVNNALKAVKKVDDVILLIDGTDQPDLEKYREILLKLTEARSNTKKSKKKYSKRQNEDNYSKNEELSDAHPSNNLYEMPLNDEVDDKQMRSTKVADPKCNDAPDLNGESHGEDEHGTTYPSKFIIVINKTDLSFDVAPWRDLATSLDLPYITISATKGTGVRELLHLLQTKAKDGPWLFSEDEYTSITERELAEEITREELYMQLRDELPYSLKVDTDDWQELGEGEVKIYQSIVVLKDSQKNIVIGEQGSMIKKVGIGARRQLEELLDRKVHLFLHVKVRDDWIDKLKLS